MMLGREGGGVRREEGGGRREEGGWRIGRREEGGGRRIGDRETSVVVQCWARRVDD
jgi:hypothetical protein